MDVYNFFQRNRDTNSKKINFVLDIIEKGLEEIRENCILNEFAKKFQQLYYNHPGTLFLSEFEYFKILEKNSNSTAKFYIKKNQLEKNKFLELKLNFFKKQFNFFNFFLKNNFFFKIININFKIININIGFFFYIMQKFFFKRYYRFFSYFFFDYNYANFVKFNFIFYKFIQYLKKPIKICKLNTFNDGYLFNKAIFLSSKNKIEQELYFDDSMIELIKNLRKKKVLTLKNTYLKYDKNYYKSIFKKSIGFNFFFKYFLILKFKFLKFKKFYGIISAITISKGVDKAAFLHKLRVEKIKFNNKIKFSDSSINKYISYSNLEKFNFFFLRKNKIFNKSRYSRNRQLYRTGFYLCLWLNIIVVYLLSFIFYRFSFNFGYLGGGILLLFYSFIFSKICKNKFYNFNNIIKEFGLLLDWYILILNNFYKFLIINIKLFFSKINLNMYVYDEIFIFDDFKSNNIIIIIFYKYIYKYIYSLLPEFIKFIEKQNKIRIESFGVEYNKKYNIVGKSFWHIDVLRYKLLKLINGGLVMTYVDDNIK